MSAECPEPAGTATVLTKSLALRLASEPDGSDVPWEGWTHIADDAAEVLSELEEDIFLDDLRALTPQAAASLSRITGGLSLGLREIPLSVAQELARHRGGDLYLPSLRAISDDVAEVLSRYEGTIALGLTRMSATAAEALLNGNASVEMSVAFDDEGTIELLFRQKERNYRPKLPWISGAPQEDGEYFVMAQASVNNPCYLAELASVSVEDGVWCLKQLAESGEHIEVEHRKLTDIICHYPMPEFRDVPSAGADAYVKRQITKKRLSCVGRELPITKDSGRLLPTAKKLGILEVGLAAIEDVLDQIATMPSLHTLTLLTESLSVEQCKSLKEFRGDLSIRGPSLWGGFLRLSDEGAALLAQKQGSLGVEVTHIPPTAAAILRNHSSFSELDPVGG